MRGRRDETADAKRADCAEADHNSAAPPIRRFATPPQHDLASADVARVQAKLLPLLEPAAELPVENLLGADDRVSAVMAHHDRVISELEVAMYDAHADARALLDAALRLRHVASKHGGGEHRFVREVLHRLANDIELDGRGAGHRLLLWQPRCRAGFEEIQQRRKMLLGGRQIAMPDIRHVPPFQFAWDACVPRHFAVAPRSGAKAD